MEVGKPSPIKESESSRLALFDKSCLGNIESALPTHFLKILSSACDYMQGV